MAYVFRIGVGSSERAEPAAWDLEEDTSGHGLAEYRVPVIKLSVHRLRLRSASSPAQTLTSFSSQTQTRTGPEIVIPKGAMPGIVVVPSIALSEYW